MQREHARRRRDCQRAVAAVIAAVAALGGFAASAQAAVWHPPQQLSWYWQLTGTVNNSYPATAYDIDGFDNSASEVAALHAAGKHVICYIDVGTYENWRSDASSFPSSVLGVSNGWPGENWLDIRQLSVLEPIMTKRFQMCQQKGFDAIEPDNMDGYQNSTGFPLTAQDQLNYNEWVASEAHALGLAVLQKNDPDQSATLQPYFDGALDEQCNQYSECSSFQPYLAAGKPVLNAEYSSSLYPGFCTSDNSAGIMGALYSLNLDGSTYEPCWSGSPGGGSGGSGGGGGSGSGGSGGTGGSGGSGGTGATGGSGGTGGAGGSGSPHRHRHAIPSVGVTSSTLTDTGGTVVVSLACRGGHARCTGTVTLRAAGLASGPLTLGESRFRIRGGRGAQVRIKLSVKAVHELAGKTTVRAVLLLAITGKGAHEAAERVMTLDLRR
jgi:hypothetical protein